MHWNSHHSECILMPTHRIYISLQYLAWSGMHFAYHDLSLACRAHWFNCMYIHSTWSGMHVVAHSLPIASRNHWFNCISQCIYISRQDDANISRDIFLAHGTGYWEAPTDVLGRRTLEDPLRRSPPLDQRVRRAWILINPDGCSAPPRPRTSKKSKLHCYV